jgi:DNA-binding transcriptional MerR regulator
MNERNEKLFKTREFARLTGVTVRALHHYDRFGLLKPSRYSPAGYRLYRESDVARLEQIIALKFIGFSLKQIKDIFQNGRSDLAMTLRQQRQAIEEKRKRLQQAVRAIQQAEYVIATNGEPGLEVFRKIIEVINMQSNMDWTKKYYSEEAQREIEKRAASVSREIIEQAQREMAEPIKKVEAAVAETQCEIAKRAARVSRDIIEQGQREWAKLIKEVEAAVAADEDPAGPMAQSLAARWSELVEDFTGGNVEIYKGLKKMYADRKNWPASMPQPFGDEVQTFIAAAMKCQKPDR